MGALMPTRCAPLVDSLPRTSFFKAVFLTGYVHKLWDSRGTYPRVWQRNHDWYQGTPENVSY